MLVIVKQMLIQGMRTFKDLTERDEAVATNILNSKLNYLEQYDLTERTNHPTNKKLYHLTEKGLSLTPVVVELALWSAENLSGFKPIMRKCDDLESMKKNKVEFIEKLKANYRENWL